MKRTFLVGLACLVACFALSGQDYKPEEARQFTQQDIEWIARTLGDLVQAGEALPAQRGAFSESSALYKALVPEYADSLPVKDKWGRPYQVFLGEAANNVYGFKDCGPQDFLVASFGKDGAADDWAYNPDDPEGGFYPYHSADAGLDIVVFDGDLVRGPKMAEIEELRIAAMKDMFYLSESLTAYSMDGNKYPEQKGELSEAGPLYKTLVEKSPTPGGVPTTDPWGHPYYVYLGEAIRGVYGIQDNEPDDCLVISAGADGKLDDWRYDPNDSGGMYPYDSPDENNDIVWYSGVLIRGPEEKDPSASPKPSPAPVRSARRAAGRPDRWSRG